MGVTVPTIINPSYSRKKKKEMNDDSWKLNMGRKEAAILLRPSMGLVMGMLLTAASPYGVTPANIVHWIENGSLPLLNAFDSTNSNSTSKSKSNPTNNNSDSSSSCPRPYLRRCRSLLSTTQKGTLKMISGFFKCPVPPTVSTILKTVKIIHVACGYQTPKIKLLSSNRVVPPLPIPPLAAVKMGTWGTKRRQRQQHHSNWKKKKKKKETILTSKRLYLPGRLIRPSTVPLVLGQFISELGFSQNILNYSLSLMGLPISKRSLLFSSSSLSSLTRTTIKTKTKEIADSAVDDRRFDSCVGGGDINNGDGDNQSVNLLESSDGDDNDEIDNEDGNHSVNLLESDNDYNYDDNVDDDDAVRKKEKKRLKERIKKRRYRERIRTEYEEAKKTKTETPTIDPGWLPSPLTGARPDKLGDINRILAVVVVACKLIPNWDVNHRYVFSRHPKSSLSFSSSSQNKKKEGNEEE